MASNCTALTRSPALTMFSPATYDLVICSTASMAWTRAVWVARSSGNRLGCSEVATRSATPASAARRWSSGRSRSRIRLGGSLTRSLRACSSSPERIPVDRYVLARVRASVSTRGSTSASPASNRSKSSLRMATITWIVSLRSNGCSSRNWAIWTSSGGGGDVRSGGGGRGAGRGLLRGSGRLGSGGLPRRSSSPPPRSRARPKWWSRGRWSGWSSPSGPRPGRPRGCRAAAPAPSTLAKKSCMELRTAEAAAASAV